MENLSLEKLTEMIMEQAKEKGFGVKSEEVNTPEKIALIHSEISEAYEAYRQKNISGKDGLAEELADAIIRVLHLAKVFNINIEKEIIKKIKSNQAREWNWHEMNEEHVNSNK